MPHPSNHGAAAPGSREPFESVVRRRFSRRGALRAAVAGVGLAALGPAAAARGSAAAAGGARGPSSLNFRGVPHGLDGRHHVDDDHRCEAVIAWGDPVLAGAPPLDASAPDPEAQAAQFGHGNDFVAYSPLPLGSARSTHGLLTVNHEHALAPIMWRAPGPHGSADRTRAELAAVGMTVVEIARVGGTWRALPGTRYARRITAETPHRITGPAAGHERLCTSGDPDGAEVLGTVANCSGGTTPWGTVLSGEENIREYFSGRPPSDGPEAANHAAMDLGSGNVYGWGATVPRFDLEREPREPNRFGWIVEVDPYDPDARPIKRTALGRFTHEAATCVVDASGRLVVYLGDDARGECLYRFVSDGVVDADRSKNGDLLDRGVLSVARFESDGTLRWLPLVHGEGPLDRRNGFGSQGDVLIETRRAAALVGGTPLDRPEDVEASPVTGLVYAALTNNTRRGRDERQPVDAANPRSINRHGHVVELIPPGEAGRRHHAAGAFRWELFLLGGDPDADHGAHYHPETDADGWLSCPDNLAFDRHGRLWIATDGMEKVGLGDGLYACDTDGDGRALTRQFFRAPIGAEVCGPCFTPDDRSLFIAVQHPGWGGGSTASAPSTRWPAEGGDLPPRPAVVVAERLDGGRIG